MDDQKTDFWSGLGAGSYSAANSALLGLPDWMVKTFGGSENYKNLQKFREQNKTASDIGSGIGTVGSFFIPGGAITKGLGLGAKALGMGEGVLNAGKFLAGSGGKLGEQVLRSGGQALEQSAIRNALDVSEDAQGKEKDLGQRLMNIGTETALGGALGGTLGAGLGKLGERLSAAKKDTGTTLGKIRGEALEDTAAQKTISGIGAQARDVALYNRMSGGVRGKGGKLEDTEKKIAKLIRDNGVTENPETHDIIEKQYRNIWENNISKAAENVPTGKVKKIVGEIAGEFPNLDRSSLMNFRNSLVRKIGDYKSSSLTPGDFDTYRALLDAKNKLDDKIAEAAKLDPAIIAKGKELKPLNDFLDIIRYRDSLSGIGGPVNFGSNTQPKQVVGDIATKMLAGGSAGATLGAATSNDDDKLKNALIGGLVGTGGGAALQKILAKGATAGQMGLNRMIGEKLTPELAEKIGNLSEKGSEIAVKSAPGLTEAAAKAPAILADAQREGQALEAANPENAPQAKVNVNSKFKATIDRALEDTYNRYYSDIEPEKFMEMVKEKTNGLDPSNPATAQIIAGFDPVAAGKYLQEYNAFLKVSSYTPDKGIGGSVASLIGTNKQENDLKNALTDALANDIGDLKSAGKKASDIIGMLKSGDITLDQVKQYLLDSHLKTLNAAGVTV